MARAVSAALRPSRLASSAARSSGGKQGADALHHTVEGLAGDGQLLRAGGGFILRQRHAVVERRVLFAGGGAAGVLLGVPDARRGKRHERRAAVRIIAA